MGRIARFTLREAVSKRLLLALGLLTLVFLGFFLWGVNLQYQSFVVRAESLGRRIQVEFIWVFVSIMGLYMVNFLASLVGVFGTVSSISSEVEGGTILTIATKPLPRWQWVLGKWLGSLILSLGYVVLLAAALMSGVASITGYTPPHPVQAIALMALNVTLLVSLTVLGSALFPTLTNGIVMTVLWGLAWTGGILGFIGKATASNLLVRLSEWVNILLPTDALWRFASYYLQTPEFLKLQEQGIRSNPFAGTDPPTLGFVLWVLAYMVMVLLATVWAFRRRDL
jgi:ABC-type transport system involved in multi-copper enzyme maturation permease subunit